MKQCSKCGELKDDSLFSIGRNQCKECRKKYFRQYNKQYTMNHKEEIKQYQLDHKDEIKQKKKQYRLDHKEQRKQYYKQYHQSESGKINQKKHDAKKRKMKYIPLMNNPFPEEIVVDDHHILNNFHAIDAEGNWNKWFVIPMPKITHNFVRGKTNGLAHWKHNTKWIQKLYDINIKELLGIEKN